MKTNASSEKEDSYSEEANNAKCKLNSNDDTSCLDSGRVITEETGASGNEKRLCDDIYPNNSYDQAS